MNGQKKICVKYTVCKQYHNYDEAYALECIGLFDNKDDADKKAEELQSVEVYNLIKYNEGKPKAEQAWLSITHYAVELKQ